MPAPLQGTPWRGGGLSGAVTRRPPSSPPPDPDLTGVAVVGEAEGGDEGVVVPHGADGRQRGVGQHPLRCDVNRGLGSAPACWVSLRPVVLPVGTCEVTAWGSIGTTLPSPITRLERHVDLNAVVFPQKPLFCPPKIRPLGDIGDVPSLVPPLIWGHFSSW